MRPKKYPYSTKKTPPSVGRVETVIRGLKALHLQFDNRELSEELKEKLRKIVKSEIENLSSHDLETVPSQLVAELRELQEFQ